MTTAATILKTLAILLTAGGAEVPQQCSVAGLYPGMQVNQIEAILGRAEEVHEVQGPKERGLSAAETVREERVWHSMKLEYQTLSRRDGQVVSLTVRSQGGIADGPWSLKIGSDRWREAVTKKVGVKYLESLPLKCHPEGEYEFAVRASCGEEGSTVLTMKTRLPRNQVKGVECDKAPPIEKVVSLGLGAILTELTLEY